MNNPAHTSADEAYRQLSAQLGLQQDTTLPDGAVRFAAINPFDSFIVQAPAGSGKTALLTQRYLALLGQVTQPEQIVAMTFTKKAAAEMRERIMAALRLGLNKTPNAGANLFEQNTHALAVDALVRDRQLGWNILQAPHRLRIKTIDGMNGYLVGQMPLLSKMGAQPQVSQNSEMLYLEAVQLTLKSAYCEDAVGQLLRLVNGRFNRAENLLVSMLKKRDQWMGHLVRLRSTDQDEARGRLEDALCGIVQSELNEHVAHLSGVRDALQEACELADFAVQNDQPQLAVLCGAWPLHADLNHLAAWRALAEWLLTADDKGLRKTVNVKNGFPAGKGLAKDNKDRFVNALADLSRAPFRTELVESLKVLKHLPEPHYSEAQWANLQWLVHLLTVAAGYLKVVFQSRGQADFIEIAQAASQALGTALEPTELAEQLDYQIKHLLVDEFQDTSAEQNSLMCKLVAGWQEGDGRTLFIVGDPMQSIYRFREAEVGNFLQAWKGRLGEVRLNPVHLTVNFRSTHGVVDWVNRTFVKVFPAVDNIEKGAVAYSPAVAFSSECAPAVQGHWTLNQTAENEAEAMLNLVQQRLAEWAELKVNNVNEPQKQSASIAILGRSRASLMGIARRLKAAHIAFKAVELENLAERQEVQDVLALSRALLHLADRPAWIALLRSPLVGLSLADLYALMGDAPYKLQQTVWHLLSPRNDQAWSHDGLSFHGLSSEGQSRLNDALPILHTALQRVGSVGFSTLVRETWLQLDGAQTVENAVALDNVQVFFDTLAGLDGEALEFSQLDSLLADLYAKADARPESQQIELMTMHKSKGLEFDTVILPGLGRKPRANDHQLVSWFAFLDDTGPLAPLEQLVIAPIDQKGQGASGLSQLLKRFENQKQDYELARLFYVACTRAKRQLHLFGSVPFQLSANRETAEGSGFVDTLKPPSSSLLAPLWSCVAADFMALATAFEPAPMAEMAQKPIIKISRLPLNRPRFTHTAQAKANHADTSQTLNKTAQALHTISPGLVSPESLMSHELLNTEVGKLVHKVLEHVVAEGLAHWPLNGVADRLMARQPIYAQWLTKQGVNRDLPLALARVQQSLLHALTHPLVRWALANHWVESATELSLVSAEPFESADQATEVMQVSPVSLHVVDRTFVDDADTRWIVDYKTSAFSTEWSALALPERQAFLTSKVEQYRPQLARYGALFRQVEHRPQKWVLYFSDLNEWVELEQALHE